MRYHQLIKEIENAPMTWLPALFHHVVKACVAKKVFEQKTGMSNYCRRIESGAADEIERQNNLENAEGFVPRSQISNPES